MPEKPPVKTSITHAVVNGYCERLVEKPSCLLARSSYSYSALSVVLQRAALTIKIAAAKNLTVFSVAPRSAILQQLFFRWECHRLKLGSVGLDIRR